MPRARASEDKPTKALPPEPEIEIKGNGLEEGLTIIPPPDAPKKVSKYARFAATEAIVAAAQEQTHNCLWGSPPKTSYVQAHPDPTFCRDLHVLVHEVNGNKKTYLLDPGLLHDPDLEGLTKIVRVVPYITHHKPPKLGLWPLSIEHESNPWVRCAINVIPKIRNEWLKVVSIKARGEYITKKPPVPLDPPDWSRVPDDLDEWLDLVFSEGDWLTTDNWNPREAEEHPVRKAIREGF
jgi:hypothetical protein